MSTALLSSTPRIALDRTCINIVKAENQSCNVTEDNNNQSDCYESMHAFKKIRTSTSGLRKSPNKWTKEENQKLASLVSSYGEKKWKRISAEMGGQKTGAQCAQHWKRVLSPEIRKGHWDENEEDLLLRLVVQYGSCWKKIAKKIPQRTDIQCRYQYLKAKQSREVMWDNKEDESLVKKVMEVANCSSSSASPSSTAATTGTLPPISVSPSSPSPSSSPNLSSSPASSASPRSLPSPLSMTDSPISSRPRFSSPSPLRNSSQFSPMQGSPSVRGKENDDSSSISSGSGSGSEEEYSLKMSGEMGKFAWNDDKHNVNMGESTTDAGTRSSWKSPSGNTKDLPLTESLCASCHSPFINHIYKVVWLEISEHMARLKLTSTLRTALECKTRFMELLGNKISFTPSQFGTGVAEGPKAPGLKSSGDIGRNGLGGSGGIAMDSKAFHHSSMSDANNIGVKINNNNTSENKMSTSPSTATTPSRYNGSNINLNNCNHNNITINITNSYTTNNTLQNGVHLQQLTHTPSNIQTTGLKPEPLMGPAQLLAKAPILSPAPPFPSFTSHPPSFSHHSLPSSFPHLPAPHTLKTQPRNIPNGLDSLAAVASILPREMLADYF